LENISTEFFLILFVLFLMIFWYYFYVVLTFLFHTVKIVKKEISQISSFVYFCHKFVNVHVSVFLQMTKKKYHKFQQFSPYGIKTLQNNIKIISENHSKHKNNIRKSFSRYFCKPNSSFVDSIGIRRKFFPPLPPVLLGLAWPF